MTQPRPARSGPDTAQLVGILLVVLGAIFLLRSLGLFDWDVVWPLLLVGLGLVIVVAAVRTPASRSGVRNLSLPAAGAERLDLALRLGAGRFVVRGGAPAGQLLAVESRADDVDAKVEADVPVARVRLGQDASWWSFGWVRGAADWRVALAGDVPTRLDLMGGAGDFHVDLEAVRIAAARLSIGAAQLRLRLPRPVGDVPIELSTGASGVTIEVPAGVEARVATSGLLSVDGRTETPGYAAATDRVTVRIEGGAASVSIR